MKTQKGTKKAQKWCSLDSVCTEGKINKKEKNKQHKTKNKRKEKNKEYVL